MNAIDDAPAPYPIRVHMDYPERLSRLSTFFRIILIIPVVIFLGLLQGGSFNFGSFNGENARSAGAGAGAFGGAVVLAIWATILVKGRIPYWLFNFQAGVNRFTTRAGAYFTLLTDKYPAFEGDWVLDYEVDYPDRLSRWKILFWKLITSIPHFIVLGFLFFASLFVVVIAWFAILFTGAFPRGLHRFVVGVIRWHARVTAYFQSLTDEFPPFSLDEDAGAGSRSAYVLSAIIGGAIVGLIVTGAIIAGIVLFLVLGKEKSTTLPYAGATSGSIPSSAATIDLDHVTFTLTDVTDPADVDFLRARSGKRLVGFSMRYAGRPSDFTVGDQNDIGTRKFRENSVRLSTDDDDSVDAVFITFDQSPPSIRLDDDATGEILAIFEIDDDDTPTELRGYPNPGAGRHVAWRFR